MEKITVKFRHRITAVNRKRSDNWKRGGFFFFHSVYVLSFNWPMHFEICVKVSETFFAFFPYWSTAFEFKTINLTQCNETTRTASINKTENNIVQHTWQNKKKFLFHQISYLILKSDHRFFCGQLQNRLTFCRLSI